MSEAKKDFMIEALNEIEDNFIEEAVTYKRAKFAVHYRKELSVLAACFAVVVLAGFAYRYMPIRGTQEVDDAEGMQVECAELGEEASATTDTFSYGVEFVPIEEDGTAQELFVDKNGMAEQDVCAYPTVEALQGQKQNSVNYSITSAKSRAQMIEEATDAFRGTVTKKEAYKTEGAIETVFTILTVEVVEVFKGDAEVGKSYTIYIPVGAVDGIATENSLSGNLMEIEVGTKGTFIPERTTPQTGEGSTGTAEAWLSYADVAEYYILNGIEHFILETE